MVEVNSDDQGSSLAGLVRLGKVLQPQGIGMELTDHQLRSLSPIALAYIGDAVYELFVRGALLLPQKRIQTYHRQVVEQVRAEKQSFYIKQLLPSLTAAEKDILRRGRNASPKGPRRLDSQTYQSATGFEALVGYLYLTDLERLAEILDQIDLVTPNAEDNPSL